MLLYPFWLFMLILSGFDRFKHNSYMVLMMKNFTTEIIDHLKKFYNEDEQKSRKMFKTQNF